MLWWKCLADKFYQQLCLVRHHSYLTQNIIHKWRICMRQECYIYSVGDPGGVCSSGSSGRVRGGAEKHEIYAAAFGGHLFYDLFSQGRGGAMAPSPPPWIRYWYGRAPHLNSNSLFFMQFRWKFYQWTSLILRCFYVATIKCTFHTMLSSYVVALLDFVIFHLAK